MSQLDQAISETVNNQNPVSDFIQAAANIQPEENKPEIPSEPVKRGRGRPKGTGKPLKKELPPKSFIPSDIDLPPELNTSPDLMANPDAEALQRKNAALAATVLIQTTGMIIASEEGKMEKDEFSNVQESFDRYFEIKGISDFPPGISLGLALGGYYVRVLTTEKSRPKIGLFFAWIKAKLSGIRKKPPQPVQA